MILTDFRVSFRSFLHFFYHRLKRRAVNSYNVRIELVHHETVSQGRDFRHFVSVYLTTRLNK